MLTKLSTDAKVVGMKEVKRQLFEDNIELVFLAKDADEKVVLDIIEDCEEKNIDIVYVDSMKDLGLACGIDVNAATAALLK